jgi:hypothetical protein
MRVRMRTRMCLRFCASLLVGIALALPGGCKAADMASQAQCDKLLDHFIDMKLSEDPRAPKMNPEERAKLRGQIALDVGSDSDVQQVKNQCLTEVTAAEYKCAIEAKTSRVWNDCIQ